MSEFDQATLARLWELENEEMMDERAELEGERFVTLFLQKLDGRSYVFEHGLGDEATDGVDVGDAEYEVFDTSDEARRAYDLVLEAARSEGTLVDDASVEGLGDVAVDGAELTDLAEENEDNDNSPQDAQRPDQESGGLPEDTERITDRT